MRIALVTLDFPPLRSSGLTIYAESLAYGLISQGHEVTVVASRRTGESRVDAIASDDTEQIRLPVGPADWISFGWQAARYLREAGSTFNVIHFVDVHFAYAYRGLYTASGLQSFRQRLTSGPLGPYHTNWRNYLFRLFYYSGARFLMERPAVRNASHIIATSETTRREFIHNYGVDPSHTSYVPIGVNVRRFVDLPRSRIARRHLGLSVDAPVILYVGFSTPRKGVEHLARALQQMNTTPQVVMVGKWERGYRDVFTEALGPARPRVRIEGYVPDAELPFYFAAADLFVFPTLLEGFGIPLVEAMAAGLPIVTTTGGSADEIVGNAGCVVPPGDSVSLAKALDRVLSDRCLASQLGEVGRERARLFDRDKVKQEFERVLCNAWNNHGS